MSVVFRVGQTDTRAAAWPMVPERLATVVPERRRRLQRAGTERLLAAGPGRLGDSGGRRGGRAGPGRTGVRFSERVTGLIPAGGHAPRWLNGMHGAAAAAGQAPGARGQLTR